MDVDIGLGSLDTEFILFTAKWMIKLPSLLLSELNWDLIYVIINTRILSKFLYENLVRTLHKSNACQQYSCNLELTLMELFQKTR